MIYLILAHIICVFLILGPSLVIGMHVKTYPYVNRKLVGLLLLLAVSSVMLASQWEPLKYTVAAAIIIGLPAGYFFTRKDDPNDKSTFHQKGSDHRDQV